MAKEKAKKEACYTKEALIVSKRYRPNIDALSILLTDGESYTIAEVDEALRAFGRKPVEERINGRG